MHIKYGLNVLSLCLLVVSIPFLSYAGEFSISDHSSVIGRNTGYPQGTTTNGLTETGNLDLIMETTVYAKNLELVSVDINGEDIDGETFIGSITPLRLRYRPHSQFTLEGGVLLAYDFGDGSDFDEVEPILRLVYQPREHIFVVAGTIIRTHSIHDAIYNDTAAFMENNEQGFQLRADLKHIKQDLWINWRVREEDNVSERFDSASTTQIRIGDFRFDGQLLLRHTGGQQNTEDMLEFNTAYLVGGSYGFFEGVTVPVLNVVEEMRIGAYFIGSSEDPDDQSGLPASDGNGIEGSLMFRTRPAKNLNLHIFGSYFYGDNLVARAGDPLYSAEEYIQIGSNFLFELAAGLKFEISGVAQLVDGTFVHTEQMYFSWGKGFTIFRGM